MVGRDRRDGLDLARASGTSSVDGVATSSGPRGGLSYAKSALTVWIADRQPLRGRELILQIRKRARTPSSGLDCRTYIGLSSAGDASSL